jgi:hypothetical protein
MRRLLFLLICAAATVILLGGCYSRLDADFGTSHKLAKMNQIYNPAAENNLEPVYGLDGIAVQGLMGKYHASFKEKKPATSYSFSIGDIDSGN